MTDTVPEVFLEVPNDRDRTLYEGIHSILVIMAQKEAFAATPPNDVLQFMNIVSPHLPDYTCEEVEAGLRGVHYALREGAALFRRNYCQ